MKKPIKIYVTTCKKMAYLLKNFDLLFQRFWGEDYIVFGETVMRPYSDQLIDFFSKVRDDYFILLHEDFYMVEHVDKKRLNDLVRTAIHEKVDRLGLQCIRDGYEDATNFYGKTLDGITLYSLNNTHNYVCSFEASIWRREFLLNSLVRGEDPWQTEVNAGRRMKQRNKVLLTKERTLQYRDAYIHGGQRIKIMNGSFHNFVPGPTVEGHWEDLKIKP